MLATGRMVQSASPFWRDLGLRPGTLVAYQGAVVAKMPEEEILAKTLLPEDAAQHAVAWALQHAILTQVYIDRELWVSAEDSRVRHYVDAHHIPAWVRSGDELLEWPEPPIKILLQDEPTRLDQLRPALEAQLKGFPVRIFKSQPDFLEIVSGNVGKADGLSKAADALHIPQSQVMAIGDAENDIDMIQWAALGVAMGQAPAEVREAADRVTDSVDQDGAAKAIERWVLEVSSDEMHSPRGTAD